MTLRMWGWSRVRVPSALVLQLGFKNRTDEPRLEVRFSWNSPQELSSDPQARHNLDIRLDKSFTFGNRFKFGLMMDMFNVLNGSTIRDYETSLEPGAYPFKYVWGLVPPRTWRFGVNFEF